MSTIGIRMHAVNVKIENKFEYMAAPWVPDDHSAVEMLTIESSMKSK